MFISLCPRTPILLFVMFGNATWHGVCDDLNPLMCPHRPCKRYKANIYVAQIRLMLPSGQERHDRIQLSSSHQQKPTILETFLLLPFHKKTRLLLLTRAVIPGLEVSQINGLASPSDMSCWHLFKRHERNLVFFQIAISTKCHF